MTLQSSHALHSRLPVNRNRTVSHDWPVAPRRHLYRATAAVAESDSSDACAARDARRCFDSLASLVITSKCPVRLDYTALGRGLVANQHLAAGTAVVSVDVFSLLCITDDPLKTNTFGTAALADWQMLHGAMPPLLSSYLLSSKLASSLQSELAARLLIIATA